MIDAWILETLSECVEYCYPEIAQHTPIRTHPFFYMSDPYDPEGTGWPLEMGDIVQRLESLKCGEHVERSMTRLTLLGRDDLAASIRTRLASTVRQAEEQARKIERLRGDAARRANKMCLEFVDGGSDGFDHDSILSWADVSIRSQFGANPSKCEELSKAIAMGPPGIIAVDYPFAPERVKSADDIARDYWRVVDAAEYDIRRTRLAVQVLLERFVDHLRIIDEETRPLTQQQVSGSSAKATGAADCRDVRARLRRRLCRQMMCPLSRPENLRD